MTHPISALGAFHTALSLLPVAAGATAFVRDGRIVPANAVGKIYVGGMLVSIITAFGLSSTGHFNAGHALGILALVALLAGTFAPRVDFLGRSAPYLQTLAMSFSFMLLLVPGINETLTRLPTGHPLASSIDAPIVQSALAGLVLFFVIGTAYQMFKLGRRPTHFTQAT
jgi:hypothetical protein